MTARQFITEKYPVTAMDFENKKCVGMNDISYICEKYHEYMSLREGQEQNEKLKLRLSGLGRRLLEKEEQAKGYTSDHENRGNKKTAHYYRGASMAYSVSEQLLKNALDKADVSGSHYCLSCGSNDLKKWYTGKKCNNCGAKNYYR